MPNIYDVVSLAQEPAAVSPASAPHSWGQKVVVADRATALGGTCLNDVCLPTKALLDAAHGMPLPCDTRA